MTRGTQLRWRVIAYVGPLLACVWAGLLLANVDPLFAPLPAPPELPAALVALSSCRPHRVRLLYTLLNAEASGAAARRWDFGALERLFLATPLARLAPLASFEVRSQIVHYGGVEGVAPNSELSRTQVDALRAALEERTHTDVGAPAAGGELVRVALREQRELHSAVAELAKEMAIQRKWGRRWRSRMLAGGPLRAAWLAGLQLVL